MGSGRGWFAGDWPSTAGVLNITAAAWTAGFHWWRSGNITRTQNISEYMLVLALCLVLILFSFTTDFKRRPGRNKCQFHCNTFYRMQIRFCFSAVCDFLYVCFLFFVCASNISGTAERICAKFTGKTCLVPLSDEF